MIDFDNNTIDLDFFKSIIRELFADDYDRREDLLDSFSENQFKAKSQIINSLVDSCEHMPPMKDWPHWKPNISFAVTSNNMYGIEGHINCVDTIDDFAMQLPLCDILLEDTISDSRGDRFLIIGKTK